MGNGGGIGRSDFNFSKTLVCLWGLGVEGGKGNESLKLVLPPLRYLGGGARRGRDLRLE